MVLEDCENVGCDQKFSVVSALFPCAFCLVLDDELLSEELDVFLKAVDLSYGGAGSHL